MAVQSISVQEMIKLQIDGDFKSKVYLGVRGYDKIALYSPHTNFGS